MTESLLRLCNPVIQNAGQLTTGELILRAALACCSLFAVVQLLSMLATHYGDRNCTSKSFFLSLLLHCCFALGWATVVDSMPRQAEVAGEPETPSVRVTLTRGDDAANEQGTSRATWNSVTSPPAAELTRIRRADQEPSIEDLPTVKETAVVTPVVPETPELAANLDAPAPTPIPESVADSTTSVPARQITDIEQSQVVARQETQNSPMMTRQQMTREMSAIDLSTRIEPQRGAAQRIAPVIEDGAVLTLPTELVPESTVPKPVGAPNEFIRRRSDPNAMAADAPEPGSSPTSAAVANTGNRRTDKFSRSGSRAEFDADQESSPPARTKPGLGPVPAEPVVASRTSLGTESSLPAPRPELARPDSTPATSRTPTRDPEPYRSRRLEQRKAIALKNGGSRESERAVEASLRWMAGIQEPNGSWSAARHGGGIAKKDPQGQNRLDGGLYADSGITGLVVLSYLGAGYTHEEGKYADVVARAINWLISQQNPNGYLGGKATRYDMMYCHAMATFALAEAYGMQSDPDAFPELRDAVRNGVRLICAMQNDDGGWRYGKGGESDMSMFGWQLMALKSAVNAGIAVPEETKRGMTKFLQVRALGARGGLAGYKANESPSPAMTAEALFCRQMFGVRPRDGATQEAVTYLRQNLPRLSVYDEYYWYYGTLAMFQYDGTPWKEWNGALRDMLIGLQRTEGPLAGSWDPNGKWAGIGGRLYSTAVSTMSLEVYYRFLRIYQTDEE